jgi:NTE family protein
MARGVRLPLRRGLVIGAGAAVGGAWAMGVLCALAETEGLDATASEVVVGTSSGSVLAALVSCGVPPQLVAQTLSGAPAGPLGTEAVAAADASDHVHRALANIPRPVLLPGNPRLAARTLASPGRRSVRTAGAALAPRGRGNLAPVGELIEEFCGDQGWPTRPRTWLVAMDFDSGRRVVFGAAGQPETSMSEAVMASCSAPGLFPPRLIGGRRYIDGGAVSVTNADLLTSEDLDEVVVLAPMAMHESSAPRSAARRSASGRLDRCVRQHVTQRLVAEVARLAATGATVRVLAPTAEDLAAMGTNPFDASRRCRVFETALRTTTSRLAGEGPAPARRGEDLGAA